MSFWRTMPAGMLLRSNRTATSIAEYDGRLSLDSDAAKTRRDLRVPLPLEDFIGYDLGSSALRCRTWTSGWS